MTAFPGKLRGSSESILSGEVRSRIPVLEKSRQTAAAQAGQVPPAALPRRALQQSWRDPLGWFCYFFFFLFLQSFPNTEKFHLWKEAGRNTLLHPENQVSCQSCSLCQPLWLMRGSKDSQCHTTATHRGRPGCLNVTSTQCQGQYLHTWMFQSFEVWGLIFLIFKDV